MIGLVVGGFDLAGRLVVLLWPVVKQRVGQRSANALVKQNKHQRCFRSFVGEAVAISLFIAFQQAMGFHLAEVITELSYGICFSRQAEAGEDGLMDVG
jgi:hypothetical protein